ncbi:hypothetical protein IPC692_23465 [Pseudomonas aeruginosa]|nr:hypothetical protein [Pseudomonas aeruginosa]MCO1767526.1 hypothetical protein [Pseudomonas aeruginosa]OPD98513.1 hypothetical protein AO994_30655 [Pseudomonas aeruginosa]OPE39098.1 hypothetical protein APB60_31125 [Pseudomonas aeruginosa]ORE50576.1 hypothetical protein B1H15_08580 [Pseudomonas aeruginosa]
MHSYLSFAVAAAETGQARPACPRPWPCTLSPRRAGRRPDGCSPRQVRLGGGLFAASATSP